MCLAETSLDERSHRNTEVSEKDLRNRILWEQSSKRAHRHVHFELTLDWLCFNFVFTKPGG